MNRPSTTIVIALAITSTIALAAVVAMAVFSGSGQSDGVGAYAGGVGEIFLILLVVGFVMGVLALLVLRRKGT